MLINKTRLWKPKTWVVAKDGRIGCVSHSRRPSSRWKYWRACVQFGADGPFVWLRASSLRKATPDEIEEVMS